MKTGSTSFSTALCKKTDHCCIDMGILSLGNAVPVEEWLNLLLYIQKMNACEP